MTRQYSDDMLARILVEAAYNGGQYAVSELESQTDGRNIETK